MKKIRITGLILMTMACGFSNAQKTISEGTITYNISTQSIEKSSQADPLKGATNTIYLKGSLSRTDMLSSLGKETTIYDGKAGLEVILKEYSGQKLMITLTKENRATQNKKFEGINFETTSETKQIAGYNCKKATAILKDGSLLTVYFAPEININNKEYNPAFKNLPGLPVQYEFENGKLKFQYLLASIDFGPLPISKFDVPKSGYRVMTYDENRQERKVGY